MKSRPTTLSNAVATIDGSFLPAPLETEAIRVLEEAMGATCYVRGPKIGADGTREYIPVPDHAIRLVAAVRVLEWRRGKPSAKLIVDTPPGGKAHAGLPDLKQLMNEHPDVIAKIFAFAANRENSIPIDVTPVASAEAAPG